MFDNKKGNSPRISTLLKDVGQIMLQGNILACLLLGAGIFGLSFVIVFSAPITVTTETLSEANSCNEIHHSTARLYGFQIFFVDAEHKSADFTINDASYKGKRFSFCQFGKTKPSARAIKERQYFNAESFIQSFLSASAELFYLPDSGSCDTHIQNRLWSLLYPEHSFW